MSSAGLLDAVRTLHRSHVPCQLASFSPDSRLVLVASTDASVRLYDVPAGKLLQQYSVDSEGAGPGEGSYSVVPLSWFPSGDRFLSGTARGLAVFSASPLAGASVAPARQLHHLPHAFIYDALVAHNGEVVVTVGHDRRIAFTRCVCVCGGTGNGGLPWPGHRPAVRMAAGWLRADQPCVHASFPPRPCLRPPRRLSDGRTATIASLSAVTSVSLSRCGRLLTANLSESIVHCYQLPQGLAGALATPPHHEHGEAVNSSEAALANGAAGGHAGGAGECVSWEPLQPVDSCAAGPEGGDRDPLDALPLAPAHEFSMGDGPGRYVSVCAREGGCLAAAHSGAACQRHMCAPGVFSWFSWV